MITNADVELITRVGPGTPMGSMLRRYWIPALLQEELPELDGTPKALRLLGEDLVAFRDSSGRVGILDRQCPHRLASLALGRNEEGGLRCLYHGWKIDVDGNVLETPCEPPNSRFKEHIQHVSYPTHEAADLIWVYMGPRDKTPAFPDFHWISVPKTHRSIGKMWESCNFIQSMEGVLDTFHTNLLHSGYEVMQWDAEQIAQAWKRPSRAAFGTVGYEDTDYGFRYAATRAPSENADRLNYVRITEYVAPFYCMNPPDLGRSSKPFIFVPIDDENTYLYEVRVSEAEVEQGIVVGGRDTLINGVDHEEHLRNSALRVGTDLDELYRPFNNKTNNYGQERDLMRGRTSRSAYSGIVGGAQSQDLAMIETMGPIADRSKENLGASDLAIIHWRNRMIAAVKEFAEGADPIGIDPPAPYSQITSVGALIPKEETWQNVTWDAQKRALPVH